MSAQSGITASSQLLESIKTKLNGSSNKLEIITARISNDNTSVEVYKQDYSSVSQLANELEDFEEPIYIFIKESNKSNQFEFLSFVPDNSPIKLKMIYASTKNTLIRQIGSNSINRQIMISEPFEIQEFLDTDTNINQKDLLTESERINLEINQEQSLMKNASLSKGHQLVSQTNGSSTVLIFDVNLDDSGNTLVELLNQTNLISFGINLDNEKVQIRNKLQISKPGSIKITQEEPSYNIYKNLDNNKYYFIYSCPSGCRVKERMIYASNRSGFIKYLNENQKIELENTIEIGDFDELEISLISENSNDSSIDMNNERKFSKPKGPMRRRK
ncbi:hypothetical protein TBLA_0F03270 [Henningerozyma blattae CBS 6284]|uniref:ADF-H domain-containing protein n=1 Tax=Henningerozyma blattae (strain ATCC 34711 / CBS 6284 / DSM 70876 / NBRC 10599 / NRRL Y-10934 / UCD 77-7) TaxID=1071380 RepID=I2H663_HENB6|nr:hypothetical protein TBLA_0F03270 [Tetrapisispora blattae CBS 6284]CCH61865.1 hypothetical protein TBLA_0F03270 [Tetrapisispora blattae CBS 6284]